MQLTREANNQQRTEDWRSDRLGRFSASQVWRLMSDPRSKADKEAGNLSESAMTYVLECVAEILSGVPAKDEFTSKYTEWGTENEPLAKKICEAVFDYSVEDTGYIQHGEYFGGSPDGLIGTEGLIEIKCPYTITSHLKHTMINSIEEFKDLDKSEYYWQCLSYLLITGRKWIDFVSYHPKFPAKMQLKRVRIDRSEVDSDIANLILKVQKASAELKRIIGTYYKS